MKISPKGVVKCGKAFQGASILECVRSKRGLHNMTTRIEINPRVCGGKPVIRGTRIPVAVLLGLLGAGETWESILEGYPEISREDLQAALLFAKDPVDRTEVVLFPAVSSPDSDLPGPQCSRWVLRRFFETKDG
jgi:uncharacterized protein (DUF433 family)